MQTIFPKKLFKFTFFCYNRKNYCKLVFIVQNNPPLWGRWQKSLIFDG